jgi:hypothetical protein
MKIKNEIEEKKKSKRLLHTRISTKKNYASKCWLNDLPFVVLCHLSSFLTGFDALRFGECVSIEIMASEHKFWRILGM